ncbi:MAG: hypothetical protein JXQ96_23175 [Cyclobacteriaceae bacterium]
MQKREASELPKNSSQKVPLPLPESFDYEMYMVGKQVGGETFHGPRASARLCEKLLVNGTPEDLANVEKIIPGILYGQELDSTSPHYGGFRWEIEMEAVEDLNAVQFLLHSLIPIVIEHADKLKPETVEQLKESIRLGLLNISNVDVGLKYTNIVLKDVNNTCLGGELLGEEEIAQRGYNKFQRWMDFTNQSGGAYEYNSTPYTAVAIDVLHRLHKYVAHPPTKLKAKLMMSRIALGAALHMHEPTGRWAGPHGRAYHGSVVGKGGSYLLKEKEMESFQTWIDDGKVPSWLQGLMTADVTNDQIVETVGKKDGLATSTYKGKTYSFGVASRNLSNQANRYIAWQSNVFAIHYQRPDNPQAGSIYTRYLLNDHWLGYFSAGIGRGTSGLLPDEGNFQGVQDGNRAIGLYVPQSMGALDHYSSAKAIVAVARWDSAKDKVWVMDKEVASFPKIVEPESVVVIESGSILLAIKPFTISRLGKNDQVVLNTMEDGTLVLELYNYKGPAKTFWELAWPGEFYQGQPQNGFYSEVVERGDYESTGAFVKAVARGEVVDLADPRKTYSGEEERKWKVEYSRDGKTLGMEVDLFDWHKPVKRWNQNGEIDWPMLQSKYAIESASGLLNIGSVKLTCGKEPAMLYVSPDEQTIVASYMGKSAAPFKLVYPIGELQIEEIQSGIIIWDKGKVTIESIGLVGNPLISGGDLVGIKSYDRE